MCFFCCENPCQFSLIVFFKMFGLWQPHPLRISIDLLWGRLGFYLELHILRSYSTNTEGKKWFLSRLEQPLFKITESFLLSLGESKHLERVCIIARHGPMKIDPRVVISLFEKVLNMTCLSGLLKYLTYASGWNLIQNKIFSSPKRFTYTLSFC